MDTLEHGKYKLGRQLHAAMTLELSTIPPYMTALISIKPRQNRVAANIIRDVMMEEMLHMLLAGNILSAIGGKVQFNAENIPSYPLTLKFDGKQFDDREFDVNLAQFTQSNIETFTWIELPEGWNEKDVQPLSFGELDVPGYTIGEFYKEIIKQLEDLCKEYGEPAVFNGDPAYQLGLNFYWAGGGSPIKITRLEDAKRAIDVIIDQGEGTKHSLYDGDTHYFDQPEEVAHFFRFREILFGRHYQSGDDPRKPPTGEAFEVDYGDVYQIKKNAKSSDYASDPIMSKLNDEFNRFYSLTLCQIADALNGATGAMYTAILNGMHDMTSIALQMVTTSIANDPENCNGAPSFEWIEPLT
jgi:hypothetical protein